MEVYSFFVFVTLIILTEQGRDSVIMANDRKDDSLTTEEHDTSPKIKTRTIVAFCAIGFLVDFFFAISISASQDILEATKIPTSLVLLAAAAPACLTSVVYPYFLQKISVFVATCAIFTIAVSGMLITSLAHEPKVKLIGVCMVSFGYGSTETVFYPLSAFYGGSTINSYALGSGFAFLAGPLSYIGLTMLACLSPAVSLLLVTSLWILFPISYIAIKEPNNDTGRPNSNPTSFKEIPYSPIDSDSVDIPEPPKLSYTDMLSLSWKTLPLFTGLLVSNICKQLLVSGVVTTIAFTNADVIPRNQYLLYVLASGAGDLLGRPYIGYLSFCGFGDKCIVRRTWILVMFNVFILIFMVLVSLFRFLPHFYMVVIIVFVNSFLAGVVFPNSFLLAGEGLGVVEKRFCRAMLTGALWAGNMAVALIGLETESALREHCLLKFSELSCYTRSSTAWEPSTACVL